MRMNAESTRIGSHTGAYTARDESEDLLFVAIVAPSRKLICQELKHETLAPPGLPVCRSAPRWLSLARNSLRINNSAGEELVNGHLRVSSYFQLCTSLVVNRLR